MSGIDEVDVSLALPSGGSPTFMLVRASGSCVFAVHAATGSFGNLPPRRTVDD
jgi:hypothetical protein